MATEIILPRVDMAMESGSVARWAVKNGDRVKSGDLVFEMNTDKSVMEVEASASGVIAGITVGEDVDMPVGAVLGYILAAGEAELTLNVPAPDLASIKPDSDGISKKIEAPTFSLASNVDAAAGNENGLRATPLARRLAREAGVALSAISGTGPHSRIESADVKRQIVTHSPANSNLAHRSIKMRRWLAEIPKIGVIVLVHGFGSNGATWEALGGALSRQGFDVYAPDLAGHGDTTDDAESFESVIATLVDALTLVGQEKIHLVGHSMGAATAVMAARRRGTQISRLTLLAPFGVGSEIDATFIDGIANAESTEKLSILLQLLTVRSIPYSPKQLTGIIQELGRGRLGSLAKNLVKDGQQSINMLSDLGVLSCPLEVIFGTSDKIIPWQHAANVPHQASVRFIADAGHMLHVDALPVITSLLADRRTV